MTTPPLTVRTIAVPDPGPLLALLPDQDGVAWTRQDQGLVGWGSALQATFTGPDRFADADAWWSAQMSAASVVDDVGLRGSGPVAFGSFSFASSGSSILRVPAVVVGHDGDRWWLTTAGAGGMPAADLGPPEPPRAPGQVRFADGALTAFQWTGAVREAVRRIVAGELSKVVLARDLEARTDHPLDVRWVMRRLAADYPDCWTFAVDGLVGATPEMLLRLTRGTATSRVLAGTLPHDRPGSLPHDEPGSLPHDEHGVCTDSGAALARSTKDLEEHAYSVQSVAEALAKHCDPVDVPSGPFILRLPNVLHLASDVTAAVQDGSSSLALVGSLHPPAAVCGTPTDLARELIAELEQMDRGRYTGPVGWLDATGDGEWGIALRCAELDPDDPSRVRLFAGCGIVAGSDPDEELAESTAKLVPMRDALQPE